MPGGSLGFGLILPSTSSDTAPRRPCYRGCRLRLCALGNEIAHVGMQLLGRRAFVSQRFLLGAHEGEVCDRATPRTLGRGSRPGHCRICRDVGRDPGHRHWRCAAYRLQCQQRFLERGQLNSIGHAAASRSAVADGAPAFSSRVGRLKARCGKAANLPSYPGYWRACSIQALISFSDASAFFR